MLLIKIAIFFSRNEKVITAGNRFSFLKDAKRKVSSSWRIKDRFSRHFSDGGTTEDSDQCLYQNQERDEQVRQRFFDVQRLTAQFAWLVTCFCFRYTMVSFHDNRCRTVYVRGLC